MDSLTAVDDIARGGAVGLALAALAAYQQQVQQDGKSLYERGAALVEVVFRLLACDRACVFLLDPTRNVLVGLAGVDSRGRIKPMPEQEIGLWVDLPVTAVASGKIPYHADLQGKPNAIVSLRDYQGKIVGVILVDRAFSGATIDVDMLWALLFLGATAGTLLLWGTNPAQLDAGRYGSGETQRSAAARPELPSLGLGNEIELKPYASASLSLSNAAMDHLIHSVTAVLELRDIETAGHTERVAELAVAIGVKLRLSKRQLVTLRRVAFLHDVGKIAIPDSILRKPGPLDHDEWAVMKRHPVASYLVASGLPKLSEDALLGIIQHHERWDGSGYPFGLCQDQIHWAARTFAVADSFDAMTSERVYKPAKPLAAAREEISSLAGSHYDPAVVEAFLQLPFDVLAEWRTRPRVTPLSGALANLFAREWSPGTTGQGWPRSLAGRPRSGEPRLP